MIARRTYKSVGRTGRSVSVVGGVVRWGNAYTSAWWERPFRCEKGLGSTMREVSIKVRDFTADVLSIDQ